MRVRVHAYVYGYANSHCKITIVFEYIVAASQTDRFFANV